MKTQEEQQGYTDVQVELARKCQQLLERISISHDLDEMQKLSLDLQKHVEVMEKLREDFMKQ